MEITKELKEKLLKANSEEEVKALLGEQATEMEVKKAWAEVQKYRNELEEVSDDEMEAVSGGTWCAFLGEYEQAKDGRDVGCVFNDYSDWDEANATICSKGNAADGWYHKWVFDREFEKDNRTYIQYKCSKCEKKNKPFVKSF